VFNIPELLEIILRHLPIKRLLHVQRVCRQWRATVESSLELQRALFFEPISSETLVRCSRDNQRQRPWARSEGDAYVHRVQKKPYLESLQSCTGKTAEAREAFFRPEASWRRMLICQPSVRSVSLYNSASGLRRFTCKFFVAKAEDGVRLHALRHFCSTHLVEIFFAAQWEAVELAIEVKHLVRARKGSDDDWEVAD